MEQKLKQAITDVQERLELWKSAGLRPEWLRNVLEVLRHYDES